MRPASPDACYKKDIFTIKDKANGKAVKKTLTIPSWLNEEAEKYHINFSSVLKEALIEKLSE
jgi:antitoxin HicB